MIYAFTIMGTTAIVALAVLIGWFGRKEMLAHPIRAFAVTCVAITSAYVMWMGYRLSNILASPEWCGKALQAEKISSQNFGGLTACVDLLKIQLVAIERNSLVYSGVVALCLLVLIVIVIAGGKLAFRGSRDGLAGEMGPSGEPLEVVVNQPKSDPIPVTPTPKPPTPAPPQPTSAAPPPEE